MESDDEKLAGELAELRRRARYLMPDLREVAEDEYVNYSQAELVALVDRLVGKPPDAV